MPGKPVFMQTQQLFDDLFLWFNVRQHNNDYLDVGFWDSKTSSGIEKSQRNKLRLGLHYVHHHPENTTSLQRDIIRQHNKFQSEYHGLHSSLKLASLPLGTSTSQSQKLCDSYFCQWL
jgi:hypothetical protein